MPPRIAIVSTYDDLCGIAGYTRALVRQLSPMMDVQVFDLDQFLLRSPHPRIQKLGDAHIKDIARQLPDFDFVNIQLEYGTLGLTTRQILKRSRALMRAARAITVTFHTMLGVEPMDWERAARELRRLRPDLALQALLDSRRATLLAYRFYGMMREMQRRKPVRAIAHTGRDARLLRDLHGIREVAHHPLAFVGAAEAASIRRQARREDFPLLRQVPPNARLIGTFGFLSPYKGFETAIRALRLLPDDHHLLIFGGVHPQSIARHVPLDSYIGRLLHEGRIGQSALDALSGEGDGRRSLAIDGSATSLLADHPQQLTDRIHFMGVLDDAGFCSAMALCDAVVIPYLEVGQTSSGPISMALDMGCRVIASRTRAFLQLARYHPDEIEFFDIGNFAELAQRLAAEAPASRPPRRMRFDAATNAELYLRMHRPGAVMPVSTTPDLPSQGAPIAASTAKG